VLTAVGVVLALIAALTGSVSVLQGRRAWLASSRPMLFMTARRNVDTGVVTLDVHNAGGGVALGTTLLFISGSSVARGYVGNFAAGRRLVITTRKPMPDVRTNPSGGVVSGFEDDSYRVAQAYFVCDGPGVRRRYRKRRERDIPSDEEMFAEEFPAISLEGLTEVETTTPMLTQP
jgi:hypothetical protein